MSQYVINISRPDNGPDAGLFVMKFYKGTQLVDVQAYPIEHKNHMLTLLRKAGRTERTTVHWAKIFDGNSLDIYIFEPVKWFWDHSKEPTTQT